HDLGIGAQLQPHILQHDADAVQLVGDEGAHHAIGQHRFGRWRTTFEASHMAHAAALSWLAVSTIAAHSAPRGSCVMPGSRAITASITSLTSALSLVWQKVRAPAALSAAMPMAPSSPMPVSTAAMACAPAVL